VIGAGPLVVVSPHLDDGAFACGELLAAHAGSIVITVFAGRPPRGLPLTPWDAASGYHQGEDVIGRRRAEDRAALLRLGATPLWLEFLDAQYAQSSDADAIAAALAEALNGAGLDSVFVPLGLFHSDHALVHAAALRLLRRRPEYRWFAYEDALYRRIDRFLPERLQRLNAEGVAARPAGESDGAFLRQKRRAIACYRSQLRALRTPGRPGYADALRPERYWRLTLAAPVANRRTETATGRPA
jgi:LmbE family N-acetylglucosaminyl deacetylase